jgi:hypothetical protein
VIEKASQFGIFGAQTRGTFEDQIHNNTVEYNVIRDVNYLTADGGGIKLYAAIKDGATGNTLQYNWIDGATHLMNRPDGTFYSATTGTAPAGRSRSRPGSISTGTSTTRPSSAISSPQLWRRAPDQQRQHLAQRQCRGRRLGTAFEAANIPSADRHPWTAQRLQRQCRDPRRGQLGGGQALRSDRRTATRRASTATSITARRSTATRFWSRGAAGSAISPATSPPGTARAMRR